MKTLNRIQSRVHETALFTSEVGGWVGGLRWWVGVVGVGGPAGATLLP